jgi:hypothetical protein
MEVRIERFGVIDFAVFGKLRILSGSIEEPIVKFECVTLESAEHLVPEGVYKMQRDFEGIYNWWVLIGEEVGLSGSGKLREQVEFHSGNWFMDSKGCIIPGRSIKVMYPPNSPKGLMAVTSSLDTLKAMRTLLGVQSCRLTITGFSD